MSGATSKGVDSLPPQTLLLFEVLVPGSGQLYSHQWIYGGIKLGLFLSFLFISFKIKQQILIPKCCLIVKNALLGGNKDDKKDEKKEDKKDNQKKEDDIIENDEENDNKEKKINIDLSILPSQGKKDPVNKQDDNPNNIKGLLNDCMAFEALSSDVLVFGSKENSCNSCFKKFMEVVLYIFWIVYAVDIYLIFFTIYPDGNGIPYAD